VPLPLPDDDEFELPVELALTLRWPPNHKHASPEYLSCDDRILRASGTGGGREDEDACRAVYGGDKRSKWVGMERGGKKRGNARDARAILPAPRNDQGCEHHHDERYSMPIQFPLEHVRISRYSRGLPPRRDREQTSPSRRGVVWWEGDAAPRSLSHLMATTSTPATAPSYRLNAGRVVSDAAKRMDAWGESGNRAKLMPHLSVLKAREQAFLCSIVDVIHG
jgi:hypothetical protein